MMRLRHGIAVLVGSFGIAHSVMPANAECPTLRIDDEFKRSTAVFVGRATAQSIATTPTLNWPRATETTFAVERVWKGEPDATIRVRVCGGTVGDESITCGEAFRFAVGSRYVVFADGQPLTTDTCHHTAVLERAVETLEWLSHKPQKKSARNNSADGPEAAPLLTSNDMIAKIGTETDAHDVFVAILTHAMNQKHREFFLGSQIRKEWLPALKNVEFVRLGDTEIAEHLSSCGVYWFIDRLERADSVVSVWLNHRCGGTQLHYVVSFDGSQWRLGPPGTGKDRGWGPGIGSGFPGPPPGCPCVGRRN